MVRKWIAAVGAKTAYIEPGSPWENGYCESFNARLRDELLNGEIFFTLKKSTDYYRKMAPHGDCANHLPGEGNTTTQSDHTVHWATALRRLKPSS